VPIKDATGEVIGLVGLSRDISDVKEIQMERDAVLRDLARSNHDLEQFAYVVSHDLKAPLRAVTNLSTWIEEDLSDCLTEDSRQHMKLLRQRVARLDLLISDILKYSRAGAADAQAVVVDSGALVRDVVRMLNLPAGWVVTITPNMPTIETHKTALEQVFANLIGNAVKHHHDQSNARIEVAATDAGTFVEFSVRDNGPGIDGAFHSRIFEVFRTLQPGDQAESSGIGLSIVKRLVERCGGEVRLESQAGSGAIFSFTWPKTLHGDQRELGRNTTATDAVGSGS
jgi:light-regulated signal transduction histidine kinase (bacteriophytochrome)